MWRWPVCPLPVSFAPCWVQTPPERVKAHAPPTLLLSSGPPISAVLPSSDSATLCPNWPAPVSPLPVSFAPCWVQVPPERVKAHAAPTNPLSKGPPIRAVLPSADSATLMPKRPKPLSSLPVSFVACWVQTPPERVNAHAAPTPPLSPGPPIRAVLPSADSATLWPNWPVPVSSLPVSFVPCWVQAPPERVKAHAAPTKPLSVLPPMRAVLPSADRATLQPNSPAPVSPPPVSFVPCWVQTPPERVNAHAAPTAPLSLGPPIRAVLPSADSATLWPNWPRPTSPPPVSFAPCWTNGSIRSG